LGWGVPQAAPNVRSRTDGGSFYAAVLHLTFFKDVCRDAARDVRSRTDGRLSFCSCKKKGKKHA
jgi:hypothetical protein